MKKVYVVSSKAEKLIDYGYYISFKYVSKLSGKRRNLYSLIVAKQNKLFDSSIFNMKTGKSTLIKMILQEVMADKGVVKVGRNVKIGYLSQHLF